MTVSIMVAALVAVLGAAAMVVMLAAGSAYIVMQFFRWLAEPVGPAVASIERCRLDRPRTAAEIPLRGTRYDPITDAISCPQCFERIDVAPMRALGLPSLDGPGVGALQSLSCPVCGVEVTIPGGPS